MAFVRMEDTHVSLIENGVSPHEQTMSLEKPFWLFMTGNILLGIWLVGILIAGFDLGPAISIAVIVGGTLLGTILPALMGIPGPRTRLSQIESSRFSLGKYGTRVTAAIAWTNAVGWDAINNVPSAISLVLLLTYLSLQIPFWAALAVLVLAQMALGIYGHHFVQMVTKYSGWVLLAALCAAMAMLASGGHISLAPAAGPLSAKNLVLAFSLIIVGNVSWAPYMSDYTRYLPATTKPRRIFWTTYSSMAISAIVVEALGYVMASSIPDQTPAGIIATLRDMSGFLAPAVLLVLALSSTPVNAINDNSAAYCMISTGIRLPRPISAVIGASLGFVIAVWGAGRFAEAFENYLLFLGYWISPWAAILLVHWTVIGQHQSEHAYSPRWTWAATIFVVVTALTMGLFSASPVYTSPIADAMGGVDIGFYVGFVMAGLLYWGLLKFQRPKVLHVNEAP